MKKALTLTCMLLVAVLLVAASASADVTGKWKTEFTTPNGDKMELQFTFKQDGAKLDGSVSGPMGDQAISDGKVDADKISFNVEMNGGKIGHEGTVAGDEIKLKVTMEGADDMPVLTLKRVKE